MLRILWHGILVGLLTILTQIGGVAWLVALLLARRRSVLVFGVIFAVIYGATTLAARSAAPIFGRVALPCAAAQGVPGAFSWVYCAMNRVYVTPDMADILTGLAGYLDDRHPDARVKVLDAGFPFIDGFLMVPHLSHKDGRQVDLALWYQGGAVRSPFGYWAFETPLPGASLPCAGVTGVTMRWDMAWVQPMISDAPLDTRATAAAVRWLAEALPAGGKLFLEPHLVERLSASGAKVRFQGCRAARHDDHIHIQL